MQVTEKVLETLDYYKIVDKLECYFIASDSYQQFLLQRPVFSVAKVSELHKKVKCFATTYSMAKFPALSSFQSLFKFLTHVQKRELHIEELVQLRIALENMKICHNWASTNEYTFFSQINFPKNLYDIFAFYFDNKGDIRSANIPDIKKIETKKKSLQKQRVKMIQEFINTNRAICQNEQATIRDNKMLVSIKSSFRSQVQGTIHSSSASSETVFMELYSMQSKNNEMEYLRYEEQRVLYTVCCNVSESLRRQLNTFHHFYEQFLDFDMIQAQYMYGVRIQGQLVQIFSTEDTVSKVMKSDSKNTTEQIEYQDTFSIHLVEATHPLFLRSEPINICFQNGYKQLIITGANGGGKTFALKVLGLLVLMNQSGIPIPVTQESYLPVFSNIVFIIGDTQNIDEGLSTFTAHLQSIKNAIDLVHKDSGEENKQQHNESVNTNQPMLFLIDEICSDTDDREGGTLAWAILEYLAQYNIYTIVTTHLALLKQYAISKDNVEIASVEIGKEDNKHSICYGVIGSSEAEYCAKKVGIFSSIIQRQQALLNEYGKEHQEYLRKLQKYSIDWKQRNKQIDTIEKKLQRKQKEVSQKEILLHEKEEKLLKENYTQGTILLQQLRKALEQNQVLQSNLQKSQQDTSQAQQEMQSLRTISKETQQELKNIENTLQQKKEQRILEYFEVGDSIQLRKNKAKGTVIQVLSNNYYIVSAGIVRMRIHASEMYVQKDNSNTDRSNTQQHHSNVIIERSSIEYSFKSNLDLRGYRVEEAIQMLDKNIDIALLQREKLFSVIHGRGEGILHKAIHEYLSNHSAVFRKEFRKPEEGGDGVTQIYLHTNV